MDARLWTHDKSNPNIENWEEIRRPNKRHLVYGNQQTLFKHNQKVACKRGSSEPVSFHLGYGLNSLDKNRNHMWNFKKESGGLKIFHQNPKVEFFEKT